MKIGKYILIIIGILAIFIGGFLFALKVNKSVDWQGGRTGAGFDVSGNPSDLQVHVATGNFGRSLTGTGTTTPFMVLNPLSATSTVELFIADVSGAATSTGQWACGTSTSPFIAPSVSLIDTVEIATGTKATLVNGGDNFIGSVYPGAGSKSRIVVKPTEYVGCVITTVYPDAYTNASSTFAGTYGMTFNRFSL